jgi:hypothetical protein
MYRTDADLGKFDTKGFAKKYMEKFGWAKGKVCAFVRGQHIL